VLNHDNSGRLEVKIKRAGPLRSRRRAALPCRQRLQFKCLSKRRRSYLANNLPITPSRTGPRRGVMKEATKVVARDGVIKFDIPHRVRQVYGRQLGVAGAKGGYSYVALFYRNNRLYEVEGKAFTAGGQAEVDAMLFQQSLDLT
jgi:hypothetical protein